MPRLPQTPTPPVNITFDGQKIEARQGDSVAAALIAAGHRRIRTTPVNGTPRGPLCLMGVCFDCLVQIDGRGNQQACMIEVKDGMQITPQDGAFDASSGLAGGGEGA